MVRIAHARRLFAHRAALGMAHACSVACARATQALAVLAAISLCLRLVQGQAAHLMRARSAALAVAFATRAASAAALPVTLAPVASSLRPHPNVPTIAAAMAHVSTTASLRRAAVSASASPSSAGRTNRIARACAFRPVASSAARDAARASLSQGTPMIADGASAVRGTLGGSARKCCLARLVAIFGVSASTGVAIAEWVGRAQAVSCPSVRRAVRATDSASRLKWMTAARAPACVLRAGVGSLATSGDPAALTSARAMESASRAAVSASTASRAMLATDALACLLSPVWPSLSVAPTPVRTERAMATACACMDNMHTYPYAHVSAASVAGRVSTRPSGGSVWAG